jgi:ankyrin repeat protein
MARNEEAPAGGGGAPPEAPYTFLDMPCDLLTCLGPVASTPGYAREMDGTQRLCRAAHDDAMLGAATADLRYEARDGFKRSRLAYACRMNDEARVAWLVECGARDLGAVLTDGYAGGAALLRRLAQHPLVDATHALVAAARVGAAELVAPLLARGAQLEHIAHVGGLRATALQAASERGHLGVVAALLAAGAGVDTADEYGHTALKRAASREHLEVVQALVAAGADVNCRFLGHTAAAWAPSQFEGGAPDKGAPVAAYLCRLPQADPSAHIAVAVWLGDVALVRGLIARGASVEERDLKGTPCLALAAERGHLEVVRALLAAGAQVVPENEADRYATSALSSAVVDKPAILALLLEHVVMGGETRRRASRALFACVFQYDKKPERIESMRLLLEAGVDANAVEAGVSVLTSAVHLGNVAAFRLLLEAGADVRGLDREGGPEEEIRRLCGKPEAVPALLAALAGARGGGGGGAAAVGKEGVAAAR